MDTFVEEQDSHAKYLQIFTDILNPSEASEAGRAKKVNSEEAPKAPMERRHVIDILWISVG